MSISKTADLFGANMKTEEIKQIVKGRYDKAAEGGAKESCCCPSGNASGSSFATEHGLYGQEELSQLPEMARNLSKGCGNPAGFANLQPGEVVVDFGCGAGIDVILAARKVGPSGKVVGVDFAPQMLERVKQSVAEAGLTDTVKLHFADMEQLDLPDRFADVVISNCVINLCPDKKRGVPGSFPYPEARWTAGYFRYWLFRKDRPPGARALSINLVRMRGRSD